jgi:DNA mismatch repair protein MutS
MAISPMMQQYLEIKEAHKDAILFFRLGDFYEMFFEDAVEMARELELTLTGRDCGLSERAPMCGVPYHAVDAYIAKLVQKGYKVAICEQIGDPANSKGLVERAVTRIITPGTVIEASMLDERASSYILSLCLRKDRAGMAFCDLSTGEFFAHEFSGAAQSLFDELSKIAPREILTDDPDGLLRLGGPPEAAITPLSADYFEYAAASKALLAHFSAGKVADLGLKGMRLAVPAAGALMRYLTETQKNALSHILKVRLYARDHCLQIDRIAAASLELTQTLKGRRQGSLLWLLDRAETSMGSRMLKSWIERPLIDKLAIDQRLDAVGLLKDNVFMADALREALHGSYDIERLLSKIAYDTLNARDCLALTATLSRVPQIKRILAPADCPLLLELCAALDPMEDLTGLLERAISPDAPIALKEGGIFQPGYNRELDHFRRASTEGKTWLSELEQRERELTGIKNLKIGYNRVFGYYIEVTRSFYDLVPYRYTRKQTLANCERFFTEELKELERTILGAEESAVTLEYALFIEIRAKLSDALTRLQRTAQGIKQLDALAALARVAQENGYVRPKIVEEGALEIKDGRHPVVEQSLGRDQFVPNDTSLSDAARTMIITGPNMAGKSTYMRQVALIALMAHMGSFVPASSASIPIIDRIFTRIGASDDLYAGQSTFMVEMTELASILKYATPQSLLVLDEVGRGTSTFDGLSIAWATVEHICQNTKAKTLFSTHYHELSELEGRLEAVVNYRITAREQGNQVIFLRKIMPGGADRSFGVSVASLAGLPAPLIARARQIMARLEVRGEEQGTIGQNILDQRKNPGSRQVALQDYRPMELIEQLKEIDVMSLTPVDALNLLFKLTEQARRI